MRLLFWIAFKNLAGRRIQTLCAVLGIAFGVATVAAVQIVDHSTVIGVREYHRRDTGTPDWRLRIRDLRTTSAEAALSLLTAERRLKAVTPLLSEKVATGRVNGKKGEIAALMVGMAPGAALPFDAYRVVEGNDLTENEPYGILLGERLAADLGVTVSDEVSLKRPAVTPAGCVDGELVSLDERRRLAGREIRGRVVGILAKRYLGASHGGRVLILGYGAAREVMDGAPYDPEFWVRRSEGVESNALSSSLERSFLVTEPQAKEVAESPEERAFRSGVIMASFLALGLGLFVIFHILSLSVTAWVRQSGLLGALGMTSRSLAGVFAVEALVLAILGTTLGLFLGVVFAKALIGLRLTTLGWARPVGEMVIPYGALWWIPIAGVITSMMGALHPLARIRSVPTLDALTQGEAALGALPPSRWLAPAVIAMAPVTLLALAWSLRWIDERVVQVSIVLAGLFGLFVVILWGLPGVLGWVFGFLLRPFERGNLIPYLVRKSFDRSLRRFAGSVTGLALVAAGLVTLHSLTASLKQEADGFAAVATPGHVYVKVPYVPAEELEFVRSLPGVVSVIPIDASFNAEGMEIRGLSAKELFAEGLFKGEAESRRLFNEGQGMVLSKDLARERQLSVGAEVPLRTLKGTRVFTVLAVTDHFGYFPSQRSFALIDDVTMRKVFCRSVPKPHNVVIGLTSPDRERPVAREIQAHLAPRYSRTDVSVVTGSAHRLDLAKEIDHDFRMFDVILFLTALLGGLGLMNSLLVSGLERTKELGLLRAVGVTRQQIFGMFLTEAALVGFISALLGGLMGIPFSIVTVEGLARLAGLPLVHVIQPLWLILALLALSLIAVTSAILPALRAGRTDVIGAIKFE